MATSAGFPFFSLPLELRLQIYGHIADKVLRETNIAKFSGLYMSCHQIKQEFEGEYMKISLATSPKSLALYHHFAFCFPSPASFPMHITLHYKSNILSAVDG
jgi:hypothetical protein